MKRPRFGLQARFLCVAAGAVLVVIAIVAVPQLNVIVPPPTGSPSTLNTTATGYPVRNVATHVLPPIPLQAPRAGRPFPVLIKAIGDRGEGVAGAVRLAGDLIGPNVAGLNGQGEAIVLMSGASAGAHSLSVALEVPCRP